MALTVKSVAFTLYWIYEFFTHFVFKPAVLFQHLLAFDCAFETVKLKLNLRHGIHQSFEHVLEHMRIILGL